MEDFEAIYIGRRKTTKGPIAYAFLLPSQIEEARKVWEEKAFKTESGFTDDLERASSLFKLDRQLRCIGGIYKVRGVVENGRIVSMVPNSPAFIQTVGENYAALATAWSVADDSAYQMGKRDAREKKADADPALTHAVAIINDRYRKLAGGDRRGFQLWLLEQIEKR